MDIEPVLKASFPVPQLEPDWQIELLLQLGPSEPAGIRQRPCQAARQSIAPPGQLPDRLAGYRRSGLAIR